MIQPRTCQKCGVAYEWDALAENADGPSFEFCAPCFRVAREEYRTAQAEALIAQRIQEIPPHFREIETFRESEMERTYGRSVFITGKHGVGKTVFLYSLAKRYIRDGRQVKIIRFPSWATSIQAGFRDENANPYQDTANVAGFGGPLFIDDLGAEKTTEYVRQLIYLILDEREQNELRTIITSNMSIAEIDAAIDPRVASRIAGMCDVLIFKGDDRRVKRA